MRSNARWYPPSVVDSQNDWTIRQDAAATAAWIAAAFWAALVQTPTSASAQAYPDATQFDRKNPHYDPKSTREAPRWVNVDVTFVEKIRLVSLAEMRTHPEIARMLVLQRGNRLSITPVDPMIDVYSNETLRLSREQILARFPHHMPLIGKLLWRESKRGGSWGNP